MDSLRYMYKIGPGPSSSHTMGPQKASRIFKEKNPDANSFQVELWGSLAATGKGHLTDFIIIETLKPHNVEIIWKPDYIHPYHPNGMKLTAFKDGKAIDEWLVFSVGGGEIRELNETRSSTNPVYPFNKFDELKKWCIDNKKELWEMVFEYEEKDIKDYLKNIWNTMYGTVKIGIAKEGFLPGGLNYPRKAKQFYEKSMAKMKEKTQKGILEDPLSNIGLLYAYTLAASEENGAGGTIVTAPTCGASGVIPGLLSFFYEQFNLTEDQVIKALCIGGMIGNVAKENASISGAEAGCQAEVGVACCMAAGMATWLLGGDISQIEYSAEMAMEHHLGLTCDPVKGIVQIPCIERNVVAASKALDIAKYALFINTHPNVSYDDVLKVMIETGKDLMSTYRETSEGGLAKLYLEKEMSQNKK